MLYLCAKGKKTVNNQKQKIRTINAKALFKYFPKGKDDKIYAIYLVNKALCRHVIKQEEDMEPCPIFDQFYKEIEKRIDKDETFLITNTTLLDKMIVMVLLTVGFVRNQSEVFVR